MLGLIVLVLAVMVPGGAVYGPKTWLKAAGVGAFVLGLSIGLLRGFTADSLATGVCLGVVFVLFFLSTGLSVRRGKRQGAKVLQSFGVDVTTGSDEAFSPPPPAPPLANPPKH
jgi:hypothetical protein